MDVQFMSDFKQLYGHDDLKDLSQAVDVNPIVSSIISRGRWLRPLIVSGFKTPLCALRMSKRSLNACGMWCRGDASDVNIECLQIAWDADSQGVWRVLEVHSPSP